MKVPARVFDIIEGPTVTRYLVRPEGKIRVRRIQLVADDLAMNMAVESVRVIAPIPGQPYVGIEVPNAEPQPVLLDGIHSSDEWINSQAILKLPLGRDITGKAIVADLTTMPHLLVAGATGSGKSVCLTSFITSLAHENTPDELRMVLIDLKMVELTMFKSLPHLLYDVAVKVDQASETLQLVVKEMEERYKILNKAHKRNIASYNENADEKLPRIVVVIDELADLLMVGGKEIEEMLVRLAQLARAVGIHIIIATQRPSSDIITGRIKANFPTRIAFIVSTKVDSRVIMDQSGAEILAGRGDMFYMSPQSTMPERIQGTFTPDSTLDSVIDRCESFTGVERRVIESEEEVEVVVVEKTLEEQLRDRAIRSKEIETSVQQYIEMQDRISKEVEGQVEAEEAEEAEVLEKVEEKIEVVNPKSSKAQHIARGCIQWTIFIAFFIVILYFLGEILIS